MGGGLIFSVPGGLEICVFRVFSVPTAAYRFFEPGGWPSRNAGLQCISQKMPELPARAEEVRDQISPYISGPFGGEGRQLPTLWQRMPELPALAEDVRDQIPIVGRD